MRENIEALNMASVFSHNDILLNNIVINRKKGKVLFNKYEKVNLSFTIVATVCSTQVNDLSLEIVIFSQGNLQMHYIVVHVSFLAFILRDKKRCGFRSSVFYRL